MSNSPVVMYLSDDMGDWTAAGSYTVESNESRLPPSVSCGSELRRDGRARAAPAPLPLVPDRLPGARDDARVGAVAMVAEVRVRLNGDGLARVAAAAVTSFPRRPPRMGVPPTDLDGLAGPMVLCSV